MKTRDYNLKNVEVCRACVGEGVVLTDSKKEVVCAICNGSGLVTVNKDLTIRITPKTPKPYAQK
jgi:DnaJ-class molecular chaperone